MRILIAIWTAIVLTGSVQAQITQPGLRDYQISGGTLYDSILYILGTQTVGAKEGLGKFYRGDSLINALSSTAGIDTLYDYTALRAYTGGLKAIKVQKPGIEGFFIQTESGTDDGGVTIVGADLRVWRRLYEPSLGHSIQWWQATPGDLVDDRDSIQQALDFVDSIGGGIVLIPPGRYIIHPNDINEGLYIGDHTTVRGQGEVSELRYVADTMASRVVIQNRMSSGQYSDYEQRVGNTDVHIEGIKVSYSDRADFKNIAINYAGVLWGSIKDTWVDSCGGYSLLIGRTNDTDTIGTQSRNVIIENIKVTNMCDVGLEVWGSENITATNIDVSGRGTYTGYGIGINVWNGAKNVLISNATIAKDTNGYYIDSIYRKMVAFTIDGLPYGDTIFGATKTHNVTFENVNSLTDIGFRINRINDTVAIHRVDSVYIRNCNLLGLDTTWSSADIRHCRTLLIEGCTFDRFFNHLQFSTSANTSYQNSVSDVTIRGNQFTWGEGIDFHGISDFNIYDNQFYYIFDQSPITVRGGRHGLIKHNYFLDIGLTTDLHCISLQLLNASDSIETKYVEITYNTACDDRVSKHTDDLVTLYDDSDSITIRNNVVDCADSDADQYINTGTGLVIHTDVIGSNWTDIGASLYPSENDNIHIPSTLSGSTGVLNVIGRIDQRYPSSSLYNIMIGYNAGNGSMTGDNNIGIGNGAVQNTSSGLGNIGIGLEALQTNTTGVGNTGLGYRALTNSNGSSNVAIGNDALITNSSGSNNTAVGPSALLSNTTATDNVGVGFRAGRYNQTGAGNVFVGSNAGGNGDSGQEQNVMIGFRAGYNSTGDANVFIGYYAGENATGHEKLYIDNSNTASPLLLGDFGADTLRINGALSVGTMASGASTDSVVVRGASGRLKMRNAAAFGGSSSDHDWYKTGTTTAPTIGETGFHDGIIAIGDDGPYTGQLNIIHPGSGTIGLNLDWPLDNAFIRARSSTSPLYSWSFWTSDTADFYIENVDNGGTPTYPIFVEATTPSYTIGLQADGDVSMSDYPNTRDDGTPVNVLGTTAGGVIQSFPVGDVTPDTDDQDITVTGASQPFTLDLESDATDASFTGAGITTLTRSGNDITITSTEVDGSTTNEIQDITVTGASQPFTLDLGSDATDATFTGAGITTVTRSSNALTFTSTEVDGSTTNEAWTADADDASTELITTQTVKMEGDTGIITDWDATNDKFIFDISGDEFTTVTTPESSDYMLMHDENGSSGDVLEKILWSDLASLVGASDHGALTGLGDDDHTQYALLAGRSSGQTLKGGTGTTDDLILQSTSGVGATGALIQMKVGNNGGTTAMTILNDAKVGIGTTSPEVTFHVSTTAQDELKLTDLSSQASIKTESNQGTGPATVNEMIMYNKDTDIDHTGDYYQVANITTTKTSGILPGGTMNFNMGYDSTSRDQVLQLISRESSATDGVVNVAGGLRFKWTDEGSSTTFTLNTGHYGLTMSVNGAKTVTLPTISSANRGQEFFIFNNDANTGNLTIVASGGQTILGTPTLLPGESVKIIAATLTKWIIQN